MFRAITFATALALAPLSAQAFEWTLDKSHTTIHFEVDHLGFSTTMGVFREFDATVNLDPQNIEGAQVSFTVQAASVDTFWGERDDHVRSADFLDVANHPEITFVTTGITKTGDNSADVTGDLTIKGVTNSVTFAATLRNLAPSPFNPDVQVAGFDLTGEIDRTTFGVDTFAPAVGAVMPVRISLELNAPADAS